MADMETRGEPAGGEAGRLILVLGDQLTARLSALAWRVTRRATGF